jgi:putative flippase GtrA
MQRLKRFGQQHAHTFFKYALVGISGTVIDVGLFTFLIAATFLGSSPILHAVAASTSFVLAVTNNYYWNSRWTFAADSLAGSKKQYAKFLIVSAGGWVLNIGFLTIFSAVIYQLMISASFIDGVAPLPTWGLTLAKITASIAVLAYNFIANRFWTFKK